MKNKIDLDKILQDSQLFPEEFKTLLMATTDSEGMPNASYAPYLKDNGDYYVYLSELSTHTKNLSESELCSVLFIQNEVDAKHLFARKRLTLDCSVEKVSRENKIFDEVMEKLETKFGKIMRMLSQLSDFRLYRLVPKKGNYISGFAQAFTLSGEGLQTIKHRNDQGHKAANESTDDKMNEVLVEGDRADL